MLSGPQEDRNAVLESIFDKIPSFLLSYLIKEWTMQSHTIPTGLSAREKLETTMDLLDGLSRSQIQTLRKLEKFITYDCVWSPFVVREGLEFTKSGFLEKFSTKEYFPNPRVPINGKLHSYEIEAGIFLLIADFSSRSSLLRTFRRFILIPELNFIFSEHDELGQKVLLTLVQKALGVIVENLPFNSMVIRSISKDCSIVKGLTFLVTTETAGVEGLETVSVLGSDVIPGAEELKVSKEMGTSVLSLGPWIGVKSENFEVDIYNGLHFKRFKLEDLKIIAETLSEED